MGYFSNGTEGAMYQERYCRRCFHYGPEEGPGCPIWGAHLFLNYSDEAVHVILDDLIPRSADGLTNEQCRMFHEAPDAN